MLDKMHAQESPGRRSTQSLLTLIVLMGGLTFGPPGPRPVSGQAASNSLLAAVLPSSRSALVGTPVTAFVAVINTGSVTVQGVGAFLRTPIAATLTFQTTDPTTNVPTGTPNAPVNLAPGATQTFVVGLTPTAAFPPTIVEFDFSTGAEHVVTIPGVNTLLVSASSVPTPDFVALAATTSNNGILEAGVSGAVATAFATLGTQQGVVLRHRGAFAVAAVNVGAPGVLTATARNTGSVSVALAVQETDPATGAVIGGNVKPMATGQTATFAVFALGTS